MDLLSQKIMKSRDISFLSLCKFICHIQVGLLQHIWSLSYSVPEFPPRTKKGAEGFLSKRPPDGELQDNFTVAYASETLFLLWRDPWGPWDLEEIWSTQMPCTWMPPPYLLLMHLQSCHGWSLLYIMHTLWAVIATDRSMEKLKVPNWRLFTVQ